MSDTSYRVLVVIPDNALLDLMGEIISDLGHKPLLYKSEKEAISQCTNDKSIAGIIIDWEMSMKYFPGILNRLHIISPYMGRFVLVNMEYSEIIEHINKSDFCCYVQKPFDLEKFEKGLLGCIKEYETAIENCTCA